MRMTYLLKDGDFSIDAIDIRLVFYLVLLQNLDGHFVSGNSVGTLFDFAESALALGLADNEAPNMFTF